MHSDSQMFSGEGELVHKIFKTLWDFSNAMDWK